uniref:MAM domain containing 2a n=1 Tax=Latimeria chalumnae TaxID=7897 RepID=H2ZVU7_LATCH
GRYIFVDASFGDQWEKAVLISPDLQTEEWSCVRLIYQLTGSTSVSDPGNLKLYIRPEGQSFDYLLWSADEPSDSWLIASADLRNSTRKFKIVLEGKLGQGPIASVAIFEINIVPGYCIDCDFEANNLCGYANYWNPNVNWFVGGGTIRKSQSILPTDHTLSNKWGHYMYVDSIYAKNLQEVAQLVSPMTTTPMSGCLSFYYQVQQNSGNIFTVYTRDKTGYYEELWRAEDPIYAVWNSVDIDIKAPHPLEVIFEVAFNGARGGYVAVDDISFSPQFCNNQTEQLFDTSVANCDFEEDFCNFYQDKRDGASWFRVTVKLNAYRTGDHTTGLGYFLLSNTRFTSQPGYLGRLYGPSLPGNLSYCLRFYYALYGFSKMSDALAVYIFEENHVVTEKVWSVSESPKGVWIQAEVSYLKPMPSKVI